MRFFRPRNDRATPSGAYRDTDLDWQRIGADEPYFGVLTHSIYLRENLDEGAKAAFYQTGVADIGAYLASLRAWFGPFEPTSALDFGCGVGRLTRALGDVTGDAVGIDISEGMLEQARATDRTDIRFQTTLPDRHFSWIVSLIVLQHIPPARGYAIIRDLMHRLEPGGCITLQVMIYRDETTGWADGGRFRIGDTIETHDQELLGRGAPAGHMSMFDYDLSIVAMLIMQAGITDLRMVHCNHGGHHGVVIYGRKPV